MSTTKKNKDAEKTKKELLTEVRKLRAEVNKLSRKLQVEELLSGNLTEDKFFDTMLPKR